MTCMHSGEPVLVRLMVGPKTSLQTACNHCALEVVTGALGQLPGGTHAAFMADLMFADGRALSLRGSWAHSLLDNDELDAMRFVAEVGIPLPPYTNIEDVAHTAAMFAADARRKSEHDAANVAQRAVVADSQTPASSKSSGRKGKGA